MRIHLIAIGGKVMHNLALELSAQGHVVTGSDDEIYDPARSRLLRANLLPESMGWDPGIIDTHIELVILGMHAHEDNPELKKAIQLGIPVVSFPEYVGDTTRKSTCIVVCGSHGKTTTTAMIMHVLRSTGMEFDYVLGGQLDGFERMVRLSGAPITVIEGDEYLSSRIDRRPKMLHYNGDVVIITGIDWDHKNVFPTFEDYTNQFDLLVKQALQNDANVIWYDDDDTLRSIVESHENLAEIPYKALNQNENMEVFFESRAYQLRVFGEHNMSNINAARHACNQVGISDREFFEAISSYSGVSRRLELISQNPMVYLDYAHAPSKVRATVRAVRSQFPNKKIIGVYELHTYSSLDASFIHNYADTMAGLDQVIIYYDEHALKMKRMPELKEHHVARSFDHSALSVARRTDDLKRLLLDLKSDYDVILLMTSGNFGGMNLDILTS